MRISAFLKAMDSQLNYADKKKRLFDSLISAEECIKGTNLEQAPAETQPRHLHRSEAPKDVSKRYFGKESIFKRPAAPISKCLKPRQAPDYTVSDSIDALRCVQANQ